MISNNILKCLINLFTFLTYLTYIIELNYRILVLKEGEIIEFDSSKALIASKGMFYELYNKSNL